MIAMKKLRKTKFPDYPVNDFTIVIPTYHRSQLLRKALTSCLTQSDFEDFKIIVVDNDNSPNSPTEQLMKSYTDRRITYVKNERNIGQIANWNKAVELARSEWVVLLHDDDELLPDFLKTVSAILKEHPDIDGLFTMPKTKSNNISSEKPWYKRIRYYFKTHQAGRISKLTLTDYYFDCGYNAPIAAVYRRANFIALGGFQESMFPISDWVFHVNYCINYSLCILAEFQCIRGEGNNDSLKKEIRIGFIEKGFEFRHTMKILLKVKWFGNWWIQCALWYHARALYRLEPEDFKSVLEKKYDGTICRFLYRSIVFLWSFGKPYFLQTEINEN